jgi:nucleotide-binding universal stress UspA family protein
MLKVLVPLDGSEGARHALDHLIRMCGERKDAEVHLLHVQPALTPGELAATRSVGELARVRNEAAEAVLQPAQALVGEAGLRQVTHVASGETAQEIASYARERGCHEICMGTRGMSAVRNLVLGSVATRVVHLTDIPVTLVK